MINVILIIILIFFSAVFSSAETTFSTVNKIRLKHHINQGNKRAEKALKVANTFENALTAILIGNNIVNIASASICTVLFTSILGEKGVGISTAVMTIVVLIFGEILPKAIAKENAESFSFFLATPILFLIFIFKPFIFFFKSLIRLVSSILGANEDRPSVTEDELKYIIEEIEEQGVLEEQESNLVRCALDFDDIKVNNILIPRVNVVGIELNTPMDEIRDIFFSEMYSRLPVYEKNMDNIIGIITQKDFFKILLEGNTSINGILQDAIYISDLKHISEALHEMQKHKIHMAVVLDQHGGTKGIVTLEDIIEELVGEIYDENDEVNSDILKINSNTYDISADISITDLINTINLEKEIIKSSATSIGGWITEILGYIPKQGEKIEYDIFKIIILKSDEQKITKLRISICT